MIKDGIVTVSDSEIKLTKLGEDFSQNVNNIFDKYDPPHKTDKERFILEKKLKLFYKLEYKNKL